MVTSINRDKVVSCRVTNSVLEYLESKGYNADSIIADLPYSKEFLTDPLNWVTYETRETLCRRAAELANDDTIMFQVGLSTPELNPLGGIESMVRMLTGPKTAYRFVNKYASLFDKVFRFKTTFQGNYQATVTMKMNTDYSPSKDSCYYTQGILAAIPTLWGLPPAVVCEKKCMCKPEQGITKEDVQYEAKSCVYEVQWQPQRSWYQRLRDNLLGQMFPVAIHVKELEKNYRQIDQKNAELVERNSQLAAVREIAIGVDNVRTIDEALSLAVEHAREIEGIRFVLVQKLDETGEFVITPYYSKIRNTYASNALKALGFDPKKILGSNSTSKKLRFRFSKLKAAQDYCRNPRVMVFPTLAELLDGVWPRKLCNSIQKILRVKKLVVVPLMVEGESWGNLLYFLTKEVPTDILEMIGAHCAIAIRNIGYTVTLAEEAVRRRILIDQSLDGIVVLDVEAKVYEANQRFAEMLGYTIEEVRELHTWDWDKNYPPEELLEMGRNVDENGLRLETKHHRKDGSVIDVDISINGAIFSGQKLIFCVCRDITEHKKMDEALRESEEKYRTIFESAHDILLLMDNKGKIVDVNGRIEDVGGYKREDIVGKDFRSLSKIMTKKSLAIIAKNYLKRMAGFNVPFYDVVMFKKNGEHVDIQISAVAIRKDGKVVGDLAILRDVTERKRAEENLRLQKDLIDRILATIPNAVLLLDEQQRVILANKSFYNLFRLKNKHVENRMVNDVIRKNDLGELLEKAVHSKEKRINHEFRYEVSGAERILLSNIFAMEEGHWLLVINDITEENEKKERLYLTDRLASVGEMASGVAHELNNPLTSIIGLSSLLTKEEMPPETKEDLEAIHAEAQRCAAIVKNLLTFARKHAPKREPIQITKILEDVLKLRAYEQRGQNITIETDFAPDLPEVFADYFQMQQVFLNIILNAETAMVDAHGHGTLKISTQRVNGHIGISFEDDGPGITKENLGVIFNPFFTTKEVGKGTGLGLSICYGIVASHGGKLYTKGPSGKGATFVVELPAIGP